MAIDDNTTYGLTGAQVKDLANKINNAGGGGTRIYFDGTAIYSDSGHTEAMTGQDILDVFAAGPVVLVDDGGLGWAPEKVVASVTDTGAGMFLYTQNGVWLDKYTYNDKTSATISSSDTYTLTTADDIYPVGSVYASTSQTAPTFSGTWGSIGSQTIGTSTVYYYERTA